MGQDQSPENEPDLKLPDDMNAFSRQLESFGARSVSANRDQLMFEAGRAAARHELSSKSTESRKTIRLWQTAALLLAAVSMGLGSTLILRPEPEARVADGKIHKENPLTPALSPQVRGEGEHEIATVPTGSDAPLPIRQTPEIEIRSESALGPQIVASTAVEELRSRQAVIDDLMQSNSGSGRSISESQTPSTFASAAAHRPILNSRLLMAGEKSRIWINNLIEEPNL